ncbi:helix-turn-helix domain-containing protein [Pseudoclavibacter sp. 13-3]|uniref:helix-turn-helix domain-containing protein n=1 Tax=Pseudoclavibacter sp. 13-3 TaxID=2901228 RepID=UPI001E46BEC6|nr:helix-turn-helix transcriptional regulator [Pseudoclavibacter sp. 13-3]MCD7100854.1 helix-turn-helix domain-containing protein [Pseudoclavibacter sp. 13-3]
MTSRIARLRAPADFGLAIQQARMARGLSQAQLAEQLDLSQSMVSEIETGKSTIYLRRLLELARATGVRLTATWEDDDASRD